MIFIEMVLQALQDTLANILFGLIVLSLFGIILLGALFFLLAVRGAWRWLIGHTWNDVIASCGRKALK